MAELHVEPKKHSASPTWLWIVLALIVVAAVVYFITRNNNNNANTNAANPNGTTSYVHMQPNQLMVA